MHSHTYLTLVAFALVHAYRAYANADEDAKEELWPVQPQAERPRASSSVAMGRSFDTGTTRWRRQLAMINADKVIVFFGAFYRIFNIAEMMIPTGVPIRTTPEDAQRVLDKFGFE